MKAAAPRALRSVHLVAPDGLHDPARPSGGNTYDRRLGSALAAAGWAVHERLVPGTWPRPDRTARRHLAQALAEVPDGAVVLLDGLVASAVPDVLGPEADRLRLVVLVHLPLGHAAPGDPRPARQVVADRARECVALGCARAVVTSSAWTRADLLAAYPLPPARVHVAEPGVDTAAVAPGTPAGSHLLCVAAVTPVKGHDDLLTALGLLTDLPWRLTCLGSLDRAPAYTAGVRRRAADLGDRVTFEGTRTGPDLDRAYAAADLVVLASRAETYGMVITEALARGLPVLATAVGGTTEALGHGGAGVGPGRLVPAGDPAALAAALRAWLVDGDLRARWRSAALARRDSLPDWAGTAARVAAVLEGVAA